MTKIKDVEKLLSDDDEKLFEYIVKCTKDFEKYCGCCDNFEDECHCPFYGKVDETTMWEHKTHVVDGKRVKCQCFDD